MHNSRWIGNRSAQWQLGWSSASVRMHALRRRRPNRAAQQGGPSPQSLVVTGDGVTPLTPVAGEVTRSRPGGQLNLKTQKLEDLANHPLFNPVIMTFGSRLACEWTCVSWMNDLVVFSALTRANFIILLLLHHRHYWEGVLEHAQTINIFPSF